MTVLGIVTIVVVGAAWLLRRGALQYVLAVAAVLPQTAGLILGDKGFPLFYLAVAVIAVLGIPQLLLAIAHPRADLDTVRPRRGSADLIAVALVIWGAVISYAGPRIFAGLPVFDPSLGVDVQVGALTPLAPTLGNLAQVGYLTIAVVFLLVSGRLFPLTRRIVDVAIWATVLLAAARLALGAAWPLELLQNMPGYPYQNGSRLAGTFYEPSVLGMYLTAAAAYFAAQVLTSRATTLRGRIAPVVGLGLVVLEFVANGSGTALVGLALVTGLGAVVLFVRALRGGRMQVRPVLIAGALAVAGLAVTQLPALRALTIGVVETKTESFSFVARGASNTRSLEIVADTFGLGVGLGGNRPSSFALFVLSSVGVLGTALLVVLIVIALRRGVRSGQLGAVWALIGALTAGAVAVPDLSTPLIWIALAACIVPVVIAGNPPALDERVAVSTGIAHG